MIIEINGKKPKIAETAFVADNAIIAGDVTIGENSSVWFGVTIRTENEPIVIGENVNIQDGCILHVDEGFPLTIENNVSVGHGAVLHGCRIKHDSLIGISATVLNGAVIGSNSLVGACALVSENKEFPDDSLIIGCPAKVKSPIGDRLSQLMQETWMEYSEIKDEYKK